jgi:hypothetical protein
MHTADSEAKRRAFRGTRIGMLATIGYAIPSVPFTSSCRALSSLHACTPAELACHSVRVAKSSHMKACYTDQRVTESVLTDTRSRLQSP